jgi:hypothetical protein
MPQPTVREAAKHGISLEIPLPGDRKRLAFGMEARPLHDFAGVESNEWRLGRFVTVLPVRDAGRSVLPVPLALGEHRQHQQDGSRRGRNALSVPVHWSAVQRGPLAPDRVSVPGCGLVPASTSRREP